MVKLPFGWRLTYHLIREPKILEEHWADSSVEAATLVDQLKQKYKGKEVRVRSQYMIQSNRDRVIVFEGGD